MKKILLFIITVILLFSVCACDKAAEGNKTDNIAYIAAVDTLPKDYEDYTVSNEFVTDINSDGTDDKITLYTDAELSEEGLERNDGNTWALVVSDGATSKVYELFSEYVQLGSVYFQVADYFKDGKPVPTITLYVSTGAGLKIMNFVYENEKGFLTENIYDSSEKSESGINLKYSTIPVY